MVGIESIARGNEILKTVKTSIENPIDAKQELTFTITTGLRDRDRDIVNPEGMIADNYGLNPVMTWAHDYTQLPVAKALKLWRETGRNSSVIKARAAFQPDSNYAENYAGIKGSMVYRMYKSGFLNAVSVGFDPIEWEPIEEKGVDPKVLGGTQGRKGTHFKSWELLEVACVPVPANAGAVIDRTELSGFTKTLKSWAIEAKARCDACTAASDDGPWLVDEDMLNDELENWLDKEETFIVDTDTLDEVIEAYVTTQRTNSKSNSPSQRR